LARRHGNWKVENVPRAARIQSQPNGSDAKAARKRNNPQRAHCAITRGTSLLLKKQSPCENPHKKNYNPSSGHQPQQTTYKVKKAKEDEPRRSRNII
jgi:hypothetical protein